MLVGTENEQKALTYRLTEVSTGEFQEHRWYTYTPEKSWETPERTESAATAKLATLKLPFKSCPLIASIGRE